MKIIYLIRHSEPIKSKDINYFDEIDEQIKNEKIPLSVMGEKKALEMANKFINVKINMIWSSSYERAISTAKYIANLNSIEINISGVFNERKLGSSDGIKDEFWLTQLYEENAKVSGGESQKETKERMLDGLTKVLKQMNDGESSVIVSHATAITFLLLNWCELVDAKLKGKKRWLKFKNKDVINDSFNTPEIFKLKFNNNSIIDIERII